MRPHPRRSARVCQHLAPVASHAYRMTLPTRAELLSDNVMMVINTMSARYADKLGIEPATIENAHRSFVEDLFNTTQADLRPAS